MCCKFFSILHKRLFMHFRTCKVVWIYELEGLAKYSLTVNHGSLA